jgi:hypothetical protein
VISYTDPGPTEIRYDAQAGWCEIKLSTGDGFRFDRGWVESPLFPDTPVVALARAVLAGNDAAIPALLDAALERWHRPDVCPWEQPIHTTACPKHGGMMSECPTGIGYGKVLVNDCLASNSWNQANTEPFILSTYYQPPKGTP